MSTIKTFPLDEAPEHVLEWLLAKIIFPKDAAVEDPKNFARHDYADLLGDWGRIGPLVEDHGILFAEDEHGVLAHYRGRRFTGPSQVDASYTRAAAKLLIHYEFGTEPSVPIEVADAK